jgi:RNA polymerase sigma-B factor
MDTPSTSTLIRELRPDSPDQLHRSETNPRIRAGTDVAGGDATVAVLVPHQRDRAGEPTFEPRTGHGLDRHGRDRSDQRALALRSLDRMHRLVPGDAERAALRVAVIAEYMPYARHLASRYGVRGHAAEDFLQSAYVGLVKAVDHFDPDFGTAFLTYATPTILGELKRYFRDTTWAVHVPRRVKELTSDLRTATETLSQRLNRAPSVHELAVLLEADPAQVVDAIKASTLHAVRSLNMPIMIEDGPGSSLSDLIGADDRGFQDVIDRETLRPLLAALSAREKEILMMRFFRSMTQTEIGKDLGVSQMQVSRLLTGILGRLRTGAGCDPR